MKIKIEIDTCRNDGNSYDTKYINDIVECAIKEALKLENKEVNKEEQTTNDREQN